MDDDRPCLLPIPISVGCFTVRGGASSDSVPPIPQENTKSRHCHTNSLGTANWKVGQLGSYQKKNPLHLWGITKWSGKLMKSLILELLLKPVIMVKPVITNAWTKFFSMNDE